VIPQEQTSSKTDHHSSRKLELRWAAALDRDEPPRVWAGATLGQSQPPQPSDRREMTEIRSRDTGLIGLIWVIDPVTNYRCLMKFVDPWAGAGGPGPWCCGHILRIFLKENNSINPKNRWNLRILQKHPELFHNYILVPVILHLDPCLTFYNYN
jgi:hypothetical protein